jgi:hypothetical protein
MWTLIDSLAPFVDELRPAFSQPSFGTGCELLLAWVMCLGQHTPGPTHYSPPELLGIA